MAEIYMTNNAAETKQIARALGESLTGGEVIKLFGELGSGKTTFTQGLAEGLGIIKHITSPTFLIMKSYRIMNHKSRIRNIYHIDLYRVRDEHDIEGLGLSEILNNTESVVVIEWPEKLGKLRTVNNIPISFEYINDQKRKITVQ